MPYSGSFHFLAKTLIFSSLIFLSSCASLINSATERMAKNLRTAMLNQPDTAIVRDGAPAYLLLLDSLVEGNPENPATLISAAKLYSAYIAALHNQPARAKILANRSFEYAQKAACLSRLPLCQTRDKQLESLELEITKLKPDDLDIVYAYTTSFSSWLQANTDDWNALAQIPKLKALFEWVITQDERYDNGNAHLYLAVIAAQIPPSLGGKPDVAKHHFEQAYEISEKRNLLSRVLYAEYYARLLFDQQLHDQLLQSVIDDDNKHRDFIFINALAKEKARHLLEESNEFF